MTQKAPHSVAHPPPITAPDRGWPLSPVLLSALVFPGVGQFVQRRWLAGAIAMAAFTVSAGWFMAQAGRAAVAYYRLAFDFNAASGSEVRPAEIAVPLAVALVVYVVSLIDTGVAAGRTRRERRAG